MFLKKTASIIKILFSFEVRRFQYYKTDTIIDIISKILYLVTNLIFWYVISDAGYYVSGWTYSDIIVFIAYAELFYGLDNAVFSMASRFWYNVYEGMLDNGLTRPMDPRLRFLLLNIDYSKLFITLVEFAALIVISGAGSKVPEIIFGVMVVICANSILALIRLCCSYFSFWHGKMDAISEVADCLTSFNKYPLVIMPKWIIYLFKFVFPFYFFSTFSAEIVNFKLTLSYVMISIAGLLCNITIWYLVNHFTWKKGLEKYEGING